MTVLIQSLEAAEGGSRELDAAVTVALQLDAKGVTHDDHEYLRTVRRDDECAPGTYWRVARSGMSLRTSDPVTTSLDAALALAERVLDEDEALRLLARIGAEAYDDPVNGTIKDLPRLLCIAILRAKEGGQ